MSERKRRWKGNKRKMIKALRVIEGMSMGDFKLTEELLENIYCYAHVGLGHCPNKHKDWEKELNGMYRAMRKDKII